jgi:hypothetical protein
MKGNTMTQNENPITMSLTLYADDLEALARVFDSSDDLPLIGLAEHILTIADTIKQIRKI